MTTLEEIDAMHDLKKIDEIYDILKQMVEVDNKDDAETLWRYARANFDKAEELPEGATEKGPFIIRGRELAEQGVAKDDNNGFCHKWMAILLSSEGNYVSKKEKVSNTFRIKEHADKAIAINPEDGTTLHFLGRYSHAIASISWMERKLATSFLGVAPPTATYDEALEYFLKAEEKRKFAQNQLWIGKTYLLLKNKSKAKEWFTTVTEIVAETESDKIMIAEAKTALKKL